MEEGAIEIVMNIANDALERMDARLDSGGVESVEEQENDSDIVCLAIAMLTNLGTIFFFLTFLMILILTYY